MSTIGYTGGFSPNRADAWIWVLSELFPGLTKGEEVLEDVNEFFGRGGEGSWMA